MLATFTAVALKHALKSFNSLEFLNPHPQVSDAVGLGWGQIICISNKFPDNADAADPENTMRTTDLFNL